MMESYVDSIVNMFQKDMEGPLQMKVLHPANSENINCTDMVKDNLFRAKNKSDTLRKVFLLKIDDHFINKYF